MEEFAAMLDAYLRFYNEGRIKESLGWKSPMQYRRSLGLAARGTEKRPHPRTGGVNVRGFFVAFSA